jgi:hypothetical protein
LIYQEQLMQSKAMVQFDASAGIYHIELISGDTVVNQKIAIR